MVAVPILAGALLRVVNGVLVDRIGPKRTGMIGQTIVLVGLLSRWLLGIHSFAQVLLLGVVLGVAGSSFAVALPLASRWYPPEHQGTALGIAGAGNSGTVFAALFAPALAAAFGWINVHRAWPPSRWPSPSPSICWWRRTARTGRRPRAWPEYLTVLRIGDAWWFMFFYSVTFGGFVGPDLVADDLLQQPVRPAADHGGLPDRRLRLRRLAGAARSAASSPTASAASARCPSCIWSPPLALVVVSFGLPQAWMALTVFIIGMLALGMGNGAVFQLVPQRFRQEIGVMTGLVGMTGGIGGFYLASSLGYAKQFTGSYQAGLLVFAILALVAVVGLTSIKSALAHHLGRRCPAWLGSDMETPRTRRSPPIARTAHCSAA